MRALSFRFKKMTCLFPEFCLEVTEQSPTEINGQAGNLQHVPWGIFFTKHWTEGNLSLLLVGGFSPFEKYARQNGNLPQVGVKIKNIWNHHQVFFWGSFKRSKLTGQHSANSTNSSISLCISYVFLNRKRNTKIGCQWRRFFMFFFKALRLRTVSAHVCWEWQLEQCGNPVTAWKNKCWKNWVTCEFHANPGRMFWEFLRKWVNMILKYESTRRGRPSSIQMPPISI